MAGVEERDKGKHNNDDNMITMTMLPLLLPLTGNLKKITINSIGRTRWANEGWETATAMAMATAMATATATQRQWHGDTTINKQRGRGGSCGEDGNSGNGSCGGSCGISCGE